MKERFRKTATVSLMLFKEEGQDVLLQKRKNTGYMDGMYDSCCSGHVEENESLKDALIREAKEEIGIIIKKEDIELISVLDISNENYLNFFFKVKHYQGRPKIMEPDKCDELKWFNIKEIPENTILKVTDVLQLVLNNKIYKEY